MRARARSVLLVMFVACAVNAFGQQAGGQGLHRLSWPGKDWSVDVALLKFEVNVEEFSDNAPVYLLFATLRTDDKTQPNLRPIMLKIRLEPAKTPGSDTELRDFAAKQLKKTGGLNGGSVKTFEYKQIPGLRYSMELGGAAAVFFPQAAPPGPKVRGMEAFFVKDGVWITVSINALSLQKEEEELFHATLDSVKFPDTSNASSSFDHYYKARSLVYQKQYKQAAEHLNAALGLEQKQRQLDVEHWRNLIVQSVDFYSAAGNNTRAKELLDYGVSLDPTFPLFHLLLAQYFTTLDDVDNTIASLEKFYLYRKNDRRTTFWIDPLKHPAFARFKTNEKFRKGVKALKQ